MLKSDSYTEIKHLLIAICHVNYKKLVLGIGLGRHLALMYLSITSNLKIYIFTNNIYFY